MTDNELLRRYRAGSQEAFAELRTRHVDWVYSASLRRVREAHLAEDVTQAVFIALAQAGPVREGVVMSAWLFGVMRFAASKALREQTRRKRRERVAAKPELKAISNANWSELAPLLDEAVAGLGRKDSQAVLLRFYERKSFVDVGGALGLTEEGARKRVSRAVEKLRHYFAERGYPTATTALVEAMTVHAVNGAPASVAAAIAAPSAAALAKGVVQMVKRTRLVRMAAMAVGASAAVGAVCAGIAFFPTSRPAQAQVEGEKPLSLPAIRIVPSATTLPATQPTSLSIDQVIAGVQTAEKAFTNLYIKDFRTTVDVMPQGEIVWKPSPMVFAGSAWYDGDALGEERVYFSEHVVHWERVPGDMSWLGEEMDLSWDGHEGRTVRVASGIPGERIRHDNGAMIALDRPVWLDGYSRYETGAGLTLEYWVTSEEQSYPRRPRPLLSQRLAAAKAKGYVPELSRQLVNGFDTVRLQDRSPVGMGGETYWLSPANGFAIVKQEYVLDLPSEWRVEGMNVYALKEAAKGVWFPLRGDTLREIPGPQQEYWRFNFTAADAVANDPKLDASIFTAKIPVGYNVSDRRHGDRFYVLMPDGSEKEVHTGEAMPRVKVERPRRPDGGNDLSSLQKFVARVGRFYDNR